jgi:hypothetical protein
MTPAEKSQEEAMVELRQESCRLSVISTACAGHLIYNSISRNLDQNFSFGIVS